MWANCESVSGSLCGNLWAVYCPSSYPSGYSLFVHTTPTGENPLNRP
ncbi:TPA: hypothetical protein RKI06_002103 [Pasteurella multocida]|nr:hypothetical protein [Pasteurella multocida]HDV7289794.1 hypothetical protein [Pasteurella multocida]